jgi:ribosomal protein S18 acetylase RimI-like enzyme
MDLNIKPLKTDLLDDFLYFFDEKAFIDNPNWAMCYCYFYHFAGSRRKWSKRTLEQNRESSIALINSGRMRGFLAYDNTIPVGWCNANSKENYSYIPFEENLNDQIKIASIVCFLIDPSYRKKGIARMLLQEVCQHYKKKEFDFIESYPVKGDKSDAHNYHGPHRLYLSEGFSIYKELNNIYVMRKGLRV